MRWDIFQSFTPEMRKALESQSLDEVNKVLGEMKVEDAEELVRLLDMGGILNFSEHGVRDETGQGGGDTDDEEEEEGEEGDVEDEVS